MKKGMKMTMAAIVVVALVGLIWLGIHWWLTSRFIEETDNAYVHSDSVALRPELSARVVEVAVDDNQPVQEGDLLVRLDAGDIRDRIAEAEAQQSVAAANIIEARRQVDLQQAAIDEAQTQVSAAEADVQQARQNLERSTSLESRQYASRQQLEDDQTALAIAQSTLAMRRASVVSANRQLTVAEASVDSAKANREATTAELTYARNQLDKTRLLAPRSGVVANVDVEAGDLAQPSMTLMQLVPIESAYVIANYKETQITRMRTGQPVELEVDAYPGVPFEGVVESLAPATGSEFSLLPRDNATGNFNKIVQRVPVKIRVTGPVQALDRLRAGLSVVPRIDTRNLDASPKLHSDTGEQPEAAPAS
ncbi:HlyD family secretion protein [Halomonas sp. M20]|uniref:HlyD family secretion protein n=1 Tax=Halomonas sp. M20 TaxID=2763264 RepID=UPI001D0B69E8|nr:HlyD family secretion protein [Halomonas sp. M20]